MTIPEKVKHIRIKLQLTQAELSKETGIPMITISRWESGVQKPQAKQFGKLLAYCEKKGFSLEDE